jgi:cystathionine beta-synthase
MTHDEPGVLAAIGHTPLVRLRNFEPPGPAKIYAKLEFVNPSGSTKDRVASYILREAVRTHRLGPGETVVAYAGRNMALSLAMVTAALGRRALLVMDPSVDSETLSRLKAFGVQVRKAPGGVPPDHPDHGHRLAQRLARESAAFYFDPYHSPLGPQAHYLSTGPEIWRQTLGRVDQLVAAIGTGSTLSGTARYLRERNPDLRAVAVDAPGSVLGDYLRGRRLNPAGGLRIEGLGSDLLCRALDRSVVTDVATIPGQQAKATAGELALQEGLAVGGSAGAALRVAHQIALDCRRPSTLVAIVPDAGIRSSAGRAVAQAPAGAETGQITAGSHLDRTSQFSKLYKSPGAKSLENQSPEEGDELAR